MKNIFLMTVSALVLGVASAAPAAAMPHHVKAAQCTSMKNTAKKTTCKSSIAKTTPTTTDIKKK